MSLSSYWLRFIIPTGLLLVAMIGVVLGYTWWMVGRRWTIPSFEDEIVYGAVAMSVLGIWQLVCFIPGIIALAKRLHDLGRKRLGGCSRCRAAGWGDDRFRRSADRNADSNPEGLICGLKIAMVLLLELGTGVGLLFLICSVVPGSKNENRFGQADHEGQTLAKLWGSFRAFGEIVSSAKTVFLVTSPYFALRLAISFLLELIGLSLVWADTRSVIYGPDRFIVPS